MGQYDNNMYLSNMFCVAESLTLYYIVDIQKILPKVPENRDVLRLLLPVKERWYIIGTALGINPKTLNSLEIRGNPPEISLSMIINTWLLEKDKEATWEMLLGAVDSPISGSHKTCDQIREFLMKPDVYTKYTKQY